MIARVDRRKFSTGFTIIELMLVLVVVSLASLLAVTVIGKSHHLLSSVQVSNREWAARHALAVDLRKVARRGLNCELRSPSKGLTEKEMEQLQQKQAIEGIDSHSLGRIPTGIGSQLVFHDSDSEILYEIQEDRVLRKQGDRTESFLVGVNGNWELSLASRRIELKTEKFLIVAMLAEAVP